MIGVAARERTPVRISHMTNAASYSHAVRSSMREIEPGLVLETEIPFPGLPEPHSQLAVPIVSCGRLLGALFVESPQDLRFGLKACFSQIERLRCIGLGGGEELQILQTNNRA